MDVIKRMRGWIEFHLKQPLADDSGYEQQRMNAFLDVKNLIGTWISNERDELSNGSNGWMKTEALGEWMESNRADGHNYLNKWIEVGCNSVCNVSTVIKDSNKDDNRRKILFFWREAIMKVSLRATSCERLRGSRKYRLLETSNEESIIKMPQDMWRGQLWLTDEVLQQTVEGWTEQRKVNAFS